MCVGDYGKQHIKLLNQCTKTSQRTKLEPKSSQRTKSGNQSQVREPSWRTKVKSKKNQVRGPKSNQRTKLKNQSQVKVPNITPTDAPQAAGTFPNSQRPTQPAVWTARNPVRPRLPETQAARSRQNQSSKILQQPDPGSQKPSQTQAFRTRLPDTQTGGPRQPDTQSDPDPQKPNLTIGGDTVHGDDLDMFKQ